jgi:stress-induced morphogen
MPMPAEQIETLIREGIPDAMIEIVDLAGDGDHYEARVVAESFRGLPRVKQHQRVYEALGGRMGNELQLRPSSPPPHRIEGNTHEATPTGTLSSRL